MKKFWELRAKAGSPTVGELLLYGDISSSTWWGDEVTPKDFNADLNALGDISILNIYINSGGGDVFAGQAIYSMLKRHPAQKNVYIDGLAASIASVIAMAGDTVYMPKNAMLMIHKAWTMAIGNANDLRKLADDMDKIDQSILTTYQEKTGLDPEKITEMVDAETWLTAEEAVELGFADEIEESKQIAASLNKDCLVVNGQSFDLKRYRNVPQQVLARETAEPRPNSRPSITAGAPPIQKLNEPPINQLNEPPQAVASNSAEPLPNILPQILDAGRTISSANEALIRQAMDCLSEVLSQLDSNDDSGDDNGDGMGDDGMGMDGDDGDSGDLGDDSEDAGMMGVGLYQAQLNVNKRRLEHGF